MEHRVKSRETNSKSKARGAICLNEMVTNQKNNMDKKQIARAKLEALFVLDEIVSNSEQPEKQETISLLLELKGHGAFATPKVQAKLGEPVATKQQDQTSTNSLLLEFKGHGELDRTLGSTIATGIKTSETQISRSRQTLSSWSSSAMASPER